MLYLTFLPDSVPSKSDFLCSYPGDNDIGDCIWSGRLPFDLFGLQTFRKDLGADDTGTLFILPCIRPSNKHHQRRYRFHYHHTTYTDDLESTDGEREEDCNKYNVWHGSGVSMLWSSVFQEKA